MTIVFFGCLALYFCILEFIFLIVGFCLFLRFLLVKNDFGLVCYDCGVCWID
jgi:hypothetical protein